MNGAKQNGKSYWNTETNGDPENLAAKIELSTNLSIERFQRLIQVLVELKDTQRLLALQAVTQELYRRADECLSQGKTMTFADDVDNGWN